MKTQPQEKDSTDKKNSTENLRSFARILGKMEVNDKVDYGFFVRHFPFLVFLTVLGLFHIANNHMAEDYIRKINRTEREIKELRWEYMSTKSELMFRSKQSEVAKLVGPSGINELVEPPFKLDVE